MILWYENSHSKALIFVKVVDYGQYGDTKSQSCSFLVKFKGQENMVIRKEVLKGACFFVVKLKAQSSIVAFLSDVKLDSEQCFYLVWVEG